MRKSAIVSFPERDRFDLPEGYARVTGGPGGECLLIRCGEKACVLYDTGMYYCGPETIENIKKKIREWGCGAPSHLFMSHTHYDHIGAAPLFTAEWPELLVVAAPKAEKVFKSERALATMKRLGTSARDWSGEGEQLGREIGTDGFRVDIKAEDGDSIRVGDKTIVCHSTPGHTDCSMTFQVLPENTLLLSESTGIPHSPEVMTSAILKDFGECVASAEKCKALRGKTLICSHFGVVPEERNETFFDWYIDTITAQKDRTVGLYDAGASYEEVLQDYVDHNWSAIRETVQPFDAFFLNADITVRLLLRTYAKRKFEEQN